MSPLGLAVQQPDPLQGGLYGTSCWLSVKHLQSSVGPGRPRLLPLWSGKQQLLLHTAALCSSVSSPHSVLRHKTPNPAQKWEKKCGGYGGGGKNEKKIPPYNINKLWQRQRGFFLAPTELLGIYFLTLHPPFSFKRYDSYCSNQPGWMEGTEAKPAPGVNTPVWKRPYCSNPALLTCPSTTSFLK